MPELDRVDDLLMGLGAIYIWYVQALTLLTIALTDTGFVAPSGNGQVENIFQYSGAIIDSWFVCLLSTSQSHSNRPLI